MRGSAFVEPDWIVMNPSDWQDIRLLTDTAGQFFGGGPFQGPYGNGTNLAASGQVTGAHGLDLEQAGVRHRRDRRRNGGRRLPRVARRCGVAAG